VAATFILANRASVRYATGAMMYFAQGIPYGLLGIAIPAWLASQGIGAADIGSYLAVIVLPWAFKLLAGPVMDRYEFLPMGRRRPWAIVSQLGLTLSLLALMLVDRPAEQIGLMMVIGTVVNAFGAMQDVAVDGMAIDLTPAREQGRLNAFMSAGKAFGWATTSAVSGLLLVTWGLDVTAIVTAAVAAVILVAFVFVLEREDERVLPWTRGLAGTVHKPGNSFRAVFGGINTVLWARTSVIVMIVMIFDGLITGYGQALMPIAAVNLFGFTTPEWSQLVAIMGLIGAVAALALGPMIDRFGAKRMLFLSISLVGIHAFLLAQTQHLWQDTFYVRSMLSIWVLMLPVVMACVIALAMAICSERNSTTQFAIYMSVANLSYAAGAKIYATVAMTSTYVETYMLLSLFVVFAMIVLIFYREERAPGKGSSAVRGAPLRRTVVMGGIEAGIFWSGAMRCPKCRTDMEQVVYEDVEIDRCVYCHGIWFDEGEGRLLRNKEAAAAIDIGDAQLGKETNKIDRYPCPRCSGGMVRMVDPDQTHIWYERCSSCRGSFFDAGEFRDLSTHSIADFFKRLAAPERT
jgi:PAT family beta-lactamase induction signal transducer AmpG